jgi:hypothetical protein
MFEHKTEKLVPLPRFIRRVALSLLVALGIGVLGYHLTARLGWIDSVLNAAMILTGMGPVAAMETTGAKLFASGYALFSGVVFLSSVSFTLAPLFHRMMHQFHIEEPGKDTSAKPTD